MDKTYQQLLKLRDLAKIINGLLLQGDDEMLIKELKFRQEIIDSLKEKDLQNLVSQGDKTEIKALIHDIFELDKTNLEVASQRLEKIVGTISELSKEKQTMHGLQSLSKVGKKQIVDVFY